MSITKPNGMKYAKLVCVTPDNRNKQYIMEQVNDHEFQATWGRVEGSQTTTGPNEKHPHYSMDEWDSILRSKTTRKKEPYTDMTELHVTEVTSKKSTGGGVLFGSHRTKPVVEFVRTLQSHANESVSKNYEVSATAVSQKQVDRAQELLNGISAMIKINAPIDPINQLLTDLYRVIPRKMKHVRKHLITVEGYEEANGNNINFGKALDKQILTFAHNLIGLEQDTLDVMAGQVVVAGTGTDTDDPKATTFDLLDSLNLDMREITGAEEKTLRAVLEKKYPSGNYYNFKFKRAFRMVNKKTEKTYTNFLNKADNKKTALLIHGRRNENFWNIYQQGLLLKPTTAVITGKMFGYGTYFASNPHKSIGYSSFSGSNYARGGSNTALLAFYDVHQGNYMHIKKHQYEHESLTEQKIKAKGFDSVFAEGGYDLRNDEYIVYNQDQSNIHYLVEISS